MKLPLLGPRFQLRDWTEADLTSFELWMQPGQRWQDFDGPYYPRPTMTQVAEQVAQLREAIGAGAWPLPRTRLVIAAHDGGTLLGTVSRYWIGKETNWLAIGIALYDPTHWGQGYGYAALGLWCDYLWATMPELLRLDLRTWSGNHGMMALARKLGFQEEARFRKARVVAGAIYDGMGYGVLREEWVARYPRGFAAALFGPVAHPDDAPQIP